MLEDPKILEIFIDMAHKSMNTMKDSVNVHNAEGAIMMQILFQHFAQTNALDNYFVIMLDKTFERLLRLQTETEGQEAFIVAQHKELKAHLVLTIMSAFAYNSQVAFKYLIEKNILMDFLVEVQKISELCKH